MGNNNSVREYALRAPFDGGYVSPDVELSDATLLGRNVVIDSGCIIGENVSIGHHTVIRDKVRIGNNTVIEHNVVLERGCVIGNNTIIQSGVFLAAGTVVGDYCYIAAHVTTVDEWHITAFRDNMERSLMAPTIGFGCRIGARALIMPGISVGDNSVVGAGSVVANNIPPGTVWFGEAATKRGRVGADEILVKEEG